MGVVLLVGLLTLLLWPSRFIQGRLLYQYFNLPDFTSQALIDTLHNQNILFVGDSLMRYQYLSLAHLLHDGQFPTSSSGEAMVNAGTNRYTGWNDFYNKTNKLLLPNEFCDCHRVESLQANTEAYEVRYYRDDLRNITLTYVQYFGDKFPIHGHWRQDNNTGQRREEYWVFPDIHKFLESVPDLFYPRPSVLLLNAGFHPHNFEDAQHRQRVVHAAMQSFHKVIWKTCNAPTDHLLSQQPYSFDAAMCYHSGIECLDLSWTYYLSLSDFVDDYHFMDAIYGDVNIQFIDLLRTGQRRAFTSLTAVQSLVVVKDSQPELSFLVDRYGRLRYYNASVRSTAASGTVSAPESGLSVPAAVDASCPEAAQWPRIEYTMAELLPHIAGDPVHTLCKAELQAGVPYPDGVILQVASQRSIFLIDNGRRREFQSFGAFVKMGFDLSQVRKISQAPEINAFYALQLGDPII